MVQTEELPAELSAPRAMPRQGQRRAALSIRLSAVIVTATIDEPRVLTVHIWHDPVAMTRWRPCRRTRWSSSIVLSRLGCAPRSDFDFEPDLYYLRRGHAKIGCRKIGVEMHCGEEPFAPYRHPGHLAAGDNHDPAKIIGDLLRIDAAQSMVMAGEPQSVHDIGMLHISEKQDNPGDAGADGDKLYALRRVHAGRAGASGRDQQYSFVQDAIVAQVVGQG